MNRFFMLLLCLMLHGLFSGEAVAFEVPFASQAPLVDGEPGDTAWERAEWIAIDKLMLGSLPEPDDFSGRYKLVWTADHLYLLAEITDDILYDSHPDPLDLYWEDDTLEIFIDADASGGDHLFSYNAFAYHISLDNQVADIGPYLSEADRKAERQNRRLFPRHVQSQWKRSQDEPNKLYWEVRLAVIDDGFQDRPATGQKAVHAVTLQPGMDIGFMVAYCDSDGKQEGGGREHFIGDVEIEPVNGDRNLGYIDASVFGKITLVE